MQNPPDSRGNVRASVLRLNAGYKRANTIAEQIYKILFSGALILGSIFVLLVYVLPWYLSVWSSGWGQNTAALVICFVPIAMLILTFFGGLIILWESIAGMMEDRPLVDEKALGGAVRAKPAQTASGATGAQREPIHDRKFRD